MKKKLVTTTGFVLFSIICIAQDSLQHSGTNDIPEEQKIVPDKLLEIGLPLLFLFLFLNIVVSVIKQRAENQLKHRMIERGVSEETLVRIFDDSNHLKRMQPLKWCLFSFASALGLLTIHFSRNYLLNQSGFAVIGIFLLFLSTAFFIYYKLISKNK